MGTKPGRSIQHVLRGLSSGLLCRWVIIPGFMMLNVCTCMLLPAWTHCFARPGPGEEEVVPILLLSLLYLGFVSLMVLLKIITIIMYFCTPSIMSASLCTPSQYARPQSPAPCV